MMGTKAEMLFSMEELIPIIAELTNEYTSKDSTSITYERANYLMETVLFCIQTYLTSTDNDTTDITTEISAKDAYNLGYQKIIEITKNTQQNYNNWIVDFKSYGNENYRDTVCKGLPAFFAYYDPRFAPQECIITMDYPTIRPIQIGDGIHSIKCYLNAIQCEDRLLRQLPEEFIQGVLQDYEPEYEKHFFNLCEVVWNHLVLCYLLEKKPECVSYEDVKTIFNNKYLNILPKERKKMVIDVQEDLLHRFYREDTRIQEYMKEYIPVEYLVVQ